MSYQRVETPDTSKDEVMLPARWVPEPQVGDSLGAFELQALLGKGGSGLVFRARHSRLEREVAIKVLRPRSFLHPELTARFVKEALAVNRARHPNIVDITDLVDSPHHPPFIVMELLKGKDLADYMADHGPLHPRLVVGIACQVCDALEAAHSMNIIHRDLKPENIFLVNMEREIPTVKLLDFGIAKFMGADTGRFARKGKKTTSGIIIGTPEYMPPEQLHGFKVDRRADIYALGVVMYEMLTGDLPFRISSPEDLEDAGDGSEGIAGTTRPVSPPPMPIPTGLFKLVLQCMSKVPGHRVQTAEELEELLSDSLKPGASDAAIDAHGALAGLEFTKKARTAAAEARAETPSSIREALEGVAENQTAESQAAERSPSMEEAIDDAYVSTAPTVGETTEGGQKAEVAPAARAYGRWVVAAVVAACLVALGVYALVRKTGRSAGSSERPAAGDPERASSPAHDPTRRKVHLISVPPGASVFQSDTGALVGQTPYTVAVAEGVERKFIIRHPLYHPSAVTVRFTDPDQVRVELRPLAVAPATGPTARRPSGRTGRGRPSGPEPAGKVQPLPRRNLSEFDVVDPFKKPR